MVGKDDVCVSESEEIFMPGERRRKGAVSTAFVLVRLL